MRASVWEASNILTEGGKWKAYFLKRGLLRILKNLDYMYKNSKLPFRSENSGSIWKVGRCCWIWWINESCTLSSSLVKKRGIWALCSDSGLHLMCENTFQVPQGLPLIYNKQERKNPGFLAQNLNLYCFYLSCAFSSLYYSFFFK